MYMKKLFIALVLACALLFASCNPEPARVLEQAKADYAVAVSEASDSSFVAFFEIEMVLDNPISALNEGVDVKLQEAVSILQIDSLVRSIDRTYNAKGKIVSTETSEEIGSWVSDSKIALDSLVYDLPEALQRLREAEIILPEANKVTLRAPLAPPFKTYYIFGTYGTEFVAVDAISGEVSALAAPKEEVEEAE